MNRIDWEPIIWFCLSAAFIFCGYFLFDSGKPELATMASALGGAGIARVRSSKPREVIVGQPDQVFRNVQ